MRQFFDTNCKNYPWVSYLGVRQHHCRPSRQVLRLINPMQLRQTKIKDIGSNSIDHQHTKHAVDSPYGKTRALEAEADDLIGSPQDRLPSV